MPNLSQLQNSLILLSKTAGAAILDIYQAARQYSIQTKTDNTPLTQADLKANDILIAGLKQLTPDIPILSEEGKQTPWAERQYWQQYWLIDPLDGTRQFIKHSGEFTVNIALVKEHQVVLGLIYVPVTGECYYAAQDRGAYKLDAKGMETRLQVRAWQRGKTLVLASHSAVEERTRRRFGHLGDFTIRPLSSSWKFCLLAEGQGDFCPRFGATCEWDTAAGQCILEQARGGIFNLEGERLSYNTKESLLNPYFVAIGDVAALHPLMPWGKWPVLPAIY
ncbi:MAG TPA: 3'(2'),5'-bisphosphate nucleotidase CysQ [Gammaproteobacteria bacterium]|nr:3'(2'),5'-bisphosphate nucleotidase CysQ [Gammaproteobacteria bacterium]